MKNKFGEELQPGKWYNFGGNVSWRITGTKRESFAARTDADGAIHKPSGPASRDAIRAALYYRAPSIGYGAYIGGTFPPDVIGNRFY